MESIDPATTIGPVHLTIADLSRSVSFYEQHLGFRVHRREARTAWLGAGGSNLVVLTQCETAPKLRQATGLYHFAILVPSRLDLAKSVRRLVQTDTVTQGFADHGVSEAIYLADPDGNGIEIYRDRARAEWPLQAGQLRMGVDASPRVAIVRSRSVLRRSSWFRHHAALRWERTLLVGRWLSAPYRAEYMGGSRGSAPSSRRNWAAPFRCENADRAGTRARDRPTPDGGIPIEDVDGGLLIRDPSQNAILFVADNR